MISVGEEALEVHHVTRKALEFVARAKEARSGE
jgi:hypothetical protein